MGSNPISPSGKSKLNFTMGALTSKRYAFQSRPWELLVYNTYDFLDAFNTQLRVGIRSGEIKRILPRFTVHRNEGWITDRSRFFFDGLKRQRLGTPMRKFSGTWVHVSWKYAIKLIYNVYVSTGSLGKVHGIAGPLVSFPALIAFKDFVTRIGAPFYISETVFPKTDNLVQPSFTNFPRDDLEKHAVILLNSNLRLESPLLNLRLRKLSQAGIPVFSLGFGNSSFVEHLGPIEEVFNIVTGKSNLLQILMSYKNITILIGHSVLKTAMFSTYLMEQIGKSFIRFNINCYLGYIGQGNAISSTFLNYNYKFAPCHPRPKILYLLQSDGYKFDPKEYVYVIYHGSHASKYITKANLILPAQTMFEGKNLYSFSLDGLLSDHLRITKPPGKAACMVSTLIMLREFFPYKGNFLLNQEFDKILDSKPLVQHPFLLFNKPHWCSHIIHNYKRFDAITRVSPSLALAARRFRKSVQVRNNFPPIT